MFISHRVLFGLFPAAPSELSHRQRRQNGERGEEKEGRGRQIDRKENFSVHSLQCDMISCLRNCKCVMFSGGLKFTLTPAGTSSAAAPQFVLLL